MEPSVLDSLLRLAFLPQQNEHDRYIAITQQGLEPYRSLCQEFTQAWYQQHTIVAASGMLHAIERNKRGLEEAAVKYGWEQKLKPLDLVLAYNRTTEDGKCFVETFPHTLPRVQALEAKAGLDKPSFSTQNWGRARNCIERTRIAASVISVLIQYITPTEKHIEIINNHVGLIKEQVPIVFAIAKLLMEKTHHKLLDSLQQSATQCNHLEPIRG